MNRYRQLTNVILVTGLVATLGLVCGHVSVAKRFQLVGFTTETFLGDAGVFTFALACQTEFPASRMCASEEVLDTVVIPEISAERAWVHPEGSTAPPLEQSCYGWSWADAGSTNDGLVVTEVGSFTYARCNEESAVACCALRP